MNNKILKNCFFIFQPSTMTTETVFKYLKKKNRPFSGNDVAIALEKEHNKNAVLKSLDKLAEHDKIILKVKTNNFLIN